MVLDLVFLHILEAKNKSSRSSLWWLAISIVLPCFFLLIIISLNILIESSSRAFVGSSKTSNSWSSIIAWTIPSFCLIPKEYFFTFSSLKSYRPTCFITSKIAFLSIYLFISARYSRFSIPVYESMNPGYSITAPSLTG